MDRRFKLSNQTLSYSLFTNIVYLLIFFQNAFIVELDDLHETNEELAEAVRQNTRRYTNMVSDVVYEMLPNYKHREVTINKNYHQFALCLACVKVAYNHLQYYPLCTIISLVI